jgi:tetratricopeptide (TPR) repeat protein/predicted Ser/Thr protein kinase
MSDERTRRAEAIFTAALERGDRAAYLDEACGDDDALRKEVESLLAHHDASTGFLASPAIEAERGEPAAPHPAPLAPGDRIGGFRVIEVIGEGGMGVVYRAEQEQPRRTVALKVIRPGAASPRMLDRFRHEAELLARLQHPGIAQIYEAGTADTGAGPQPFFAMELVDGRPLLDHADARDLDTGQRLELLARICAAVHHAHQKGVIHRDLKPSNILVDAEGQPKVLDFGVARATDTDLRTTTKRTELGQLIGTVAYMSPEQATGDPGLIDIRSDVYSLGVLGYELLTGRLPYDLEEKLVYEAVRVIRETDARPLGTIDRGWRGDVETMLGKTLAKEKERRYQSASELAADIGRFLRNEPITARPASAVYQLRKFTRRNPALATSAAIIVVLLVVGVTAVSRLAVSLADERDHAFDLQTAAETEAEKAKRVNDVLLGMFAAVDPNIDGRTVLVVDLLDRAVATIDEELTGQPEIEAALRDSLGTTYLNLGLYDEADPQITRAHEIRRAVLGDDHEDTGISTLHVGLLRKEQGRFDEAEQRYGEARRILAAARGPEDPDTLAATNNLAETLKAQGRFAEAEPIYDEILAVQRRVLGDEHPDTLGTINNRAGILIDLGRPEEAVPLYEEMLPVVRRTFGDAHPATLTTVNNLGSVLQDLGRREEAEPYRREAMELSRQVLSDAHPRTIVTIQAYAQLLTEMDRSDEADRLYTEAVALAEEHLAEHWMLGYVLGGYGDHLTRVERYDEAAAALERALAILRETFGDEHPRTAVVKERMGRLEEARGGG